MGDSDVRNEHLTAERASQQTEVFRHPRHWKGHPPVYCPDPKLPTGLKGWYRCPGCGAKTRLAEDEGFMAPARRDGERLAGLIVAALTFPFRRQPEPEPEPCECACHTTCGPCCHTTYTAEVIE